MTQIRFEPIPATTLVDLLRWRAVHQPQRRAYTFLEDGETEAIHWNYAELDHHARAIGAQLRNLGAAGERVLLLYPPGLNYIAGFFGCLYAGAVAVPTYPPRRNRLDFRLEMIVKDSQAAFCLAEAAVLSGLEQRLAQLPDLAQLQWLATAQIDNTLAGQWQAPAITADTLAFLQYTSGSTGSPKGVKISHGNVLHNAAMIQHGFGDTPASRGLSWLPPYHDMGLVAIIQPLYVGAPTVLMSPVAFLQKPVRWLRAISHFEATTSGGPNFAYDLCLEKITPEQCNGLDLSSWDLAFTGAEPVRPETIEKFTQTFAPYGFRREAFYPCYGLAEATLFVTGGLRTAPPVVQYVDRTALGQNQIMPVPACAEHAHAIVGCGQGGAGQKILIVDPETLKPCRPAEIGEIWVAGPHVSRGYWNKPELSAQTLNAHLAGTGDGPFLRTGDLGFLQDGELFITGRRKDLIIIRGQNHYPQDIELTVEKSHPALQPGAGAAFSIDVQGAERLVIAQEITRHARQTLNVAEVTGAVRRAVLAEHGLDVYAVLLLKPVSIPKTTSGKIQRQACKTGFLDKILAVQGEWQQTTPPAKDVPGPETSVKATRPPSNETDIQTWLVEKIAQQRQCPAADININTPFTHYGLDSLAAITLSGELADWLERPVSPTLLYDYPTIVTLAQHLAGTTPAHHSSPVPGTDSMSGTDLIAIIGLGCRFPGANDPPAFWQLLREGVDAIGEVPPGRWQTENFANMSPDTLSIRWGGFLEQVDLFDPFFFGISPREAAQMDPQQRLLLEVSWEALENAGLAPPQLAGSQTGVFTGISSNDYARLQFGPLAQFTTYTGTGNALSIAANRLSYLLDLRGPSLIVDTACSSALLAVHLACQSLRQGESDLALAGGVNLILSPDLSRIFAQAGMLAADGRCKAFDAAADGYGRGEGCGVVVLKRLADAVADKDNILAVIKGSAVNQDGRTNGLTAPNGPSQQQVIRQALKNAQVSPHEIGYIETHGTGTPLGDPIEVNALQAVFATTQPEPTPCWIGSVKTNIGHLEAAAGIAGLCKVVLALHYGEIPPHVHLASLNPHISLKNSPLAIPTERQPWPAHKPRLAGISSFGFGGTNVHLVVQEAPAITKPDRHTVQDRPLHLLALSAKTAPALEELIRRYQTILATTPGQNIADVCFSANKGRVHFQHRLGVVAASCDELQQKLAAQMPVSTLAGGKKSRPRQTGIVFLFTGQGAQYAGMGHQLYATQPTFRNVMDRCNKILQPYLDVPLLDILYSGQANLQSTSLDDPVYAQPALFALEYALAEVWRSWGVAPAVVLGHSVGEIVAACVAGCFSLEDGLKLATERGRLRQALPQNGEMPAALEGAAGQVPVNALRMPLVSNLTGEIFPPGYILDAAYWRRQTRETAQFAAGINTLFRQGYRTFLELGPRPVLSTLGRQGREDEVAIWLASLNQEEENWRVLLESAATLYGQGVDIDWTGFDRDYPRRRISFLPTYPFQRKRYWFSSLPSNDKRAQPDIGSAKSDPQPDDLAGITDEMLERLMQQQLKTMANLMGRQLATLSDNDPE
ncbi:MAG: AMP-binding protein [Anaerolineae bacterium]|nr:AMP-binding protein [Anaerolineae bacterium]